MARWPWSDDADSSDPAPPGGVEIEPLHFCEFQDGTIYLYDDHVYIERADASKFEDKTIPRDEVTDVDYSGGIAIGYLQIEQAGFENDGGGFLTSPVDENTLHFGRRDRDCAQEAREELLFESQPP